jgi:uncharacterized protein (DUF1499 family)
MAKFRDIWVRAALALALLTPFYFAFAALGSRFGIIPWQVGLMQMSLIGGAALLSVIILMALIGVALGFFVKPQRGRRIAAAALLAPVLAVSYLGVMAASAGNPPPIHDISTDQTDPPGFSEAVIQARAGLNSLDRVGVRIPESGFAGSWAGMPIEEAQRAAYSDIAPIIVNMPAERAFDVALAAAREQGGWTVGATDAAAGRIEATARTFWFGFTDDVAIRVRPEGAGSRIDVRSVSRVGGSDAGANAARVRKYLTHLSEMLRV